MKKFLVCVMSLITLLLPLDIKADNYTSLGLKEALDDEGISYDLDNYQETDDKVTIYLFRGKGCSHCYEFLTYLSTIVDEYGDYFKLESYEIWGDSNNASLMNQVANFLGDTEIGVPYIIIGDQSFIGFDSSMGSQIEDAIVNLYNSSDRYDILADLESNGYAVSADYDNSSSSSISLDISTFLLLMLAMCVTIIVVVVFSINNNRKILEARLDELEKKSNNNC